jgi:hypothetical protein
MGDLIFPDFKTKDRRYTKGGGIDDLDLAEIANVLRAAGRENPYDNAPSEMPPVWPSFEAPDQDPA